MKEVESWDRSTVFFSFVFFCFSHRKNLTPKYSWFFYPLWKKDSFGVFHIQFPSKQPSYFLKVTYPRNHLFFFFFFLILTHPPSLQVFTVVHLCLYEYLEIWHYQLWKLGVLLFPGGPSLSLAASPDLVADITTVDISAPLLFSLNRLRVCSTFLSQWWNLLYDQLRQGNEKFLGLSTVENNIWKSYLNGEKKSKDLKSWIVFLTGIKLVLRMIWVFWRCSTKQCFCFGLEIKVKDIKKQMIPKNQWSPNQDRQQEGLCFLSTCCITHRVQKGEDTKLQ